MNKTGRYLLFPCYFLMLVLTGYGIWSLAVENTEIHDQSNRDFVGVEVVTVANQKAKPAKVDFHTQIAPIFTNHCSRCHSGHSRKGGFSLNTHKDFLTGGDSGDVIVKGKPGESLLIELVTESDAELRMPSKSKPLSKQQIQLLKDWIAQGANWPKDFRFVKWKKAPLAPREVKLPAGDVKANPIDRLLEVYYKKNKIQILKVVDDRTFARRVWLDLVGLLPPPDQLAVFLADKSPGKRAKLVDQLLADKKAYTEHWLTFWSDMLRNAYRGTGYIDGGRRSITQWLYRSLYENKPYNQFVQELLDPSAGSQGFINGIKWRGNVNASQRREMQAAQNVGQVFMGTNLKCASCHDSFINYWTLADTYNLAAIFSDKPLEMHRCDKPTGKMTTAGFIYPELGKIDPKASKKAKMAQLAKAMVSPKNGRFSRTLVNRLWNQLLGHGIIASVDDLDEKPFDADLLDWLAFEFAKKQYDMKHILRLICTSKAYQLPAIGEKEHLEKSFVFRGPIVRRMSAEQFVDAVAVMTNAAAGNLAVKLGPPYKSGSTSFPYIRASLTNDDPLQRSLGRPNREQVVTRRDSIATTLQMLELTNGNVLDLRLKKAADYWLKQSGGNATKLVEQLYRKALGRSPTDEEKAVSKSILGSPIKKQATQDLVWIILMLPEFQLIQ